MNLSEDHGPPSETSESNLTPRTESKEDDSVLSYEAVGADEGTYLSAREAPFYESQAAPQPHVLQVPWGWLDLLLLGCAFIGITVATILGMVIWGASRNWTSSDKMSFVVLDQLVVSVVILGYLAAQMRLRFNRPFWRTLGWRSIHIDKTPSLVAYLGLIFSGFLLSILVQLGSVAVGTKGKLPIEAFFQDRRAALLLMLMSVLLAPLFEETIFRGYIYPVVARSFGVTTGIIATGTLFGLLHAQQLWGGWDQIGLLILVGIVFTWLRAVTKTVLASYLVHLSYNSFLFFAFLFTSHGLRSLPSGP